MKTPYFSNRSNKLQNSYSRLLIDNHITDISPEFMSKFDCNQYIQMIKKAGVDCVMVYASCHNGNCYYPTKIGHIHRNLNGRDIFGEQVDKLNQEGIIPVAYYTICWHNHSAKNNPKWQFTDLLGRHNSARYWMSCPNNPQYREYVKGMLTEIADYEIAGIFIDMTFWPGVCFCDCCKEKFGKTIPLVINWEDPSWVEFQRARERWIAEFAALIKEHIKKIIPQLTITHNFGAMLLGWYLSQNPSMVDAIDYPSGDFYGGREQHRIGAKIFSSFTNDYPFEFMNSRCVNLYDHTSTKSEDELVCSGATTLANGGAYMFIDAINPDGTLEEDVYDKLEAVSSKLEGLKNKLVEKKPKLHSDIGLYFSMLSNIDLQLNGKHLEEIIKDASVSNMSTLIKSRMLDEVIGASSLLNQLHIPYQVITNRDKDLSRYKTIIINEAYFMSEGEVNRIRSFVKNGGTLIATGLTSMSNLTGKISEDFGLADVFGVSYTGKNCCRVNYLKENNKYIACDYPAPLVEPKTAKILATLTVPKFDPDDCENYASIHSNPPGRDLENPALTVNIFNKGKCVYLAQSLMAIKQNSQEEYLKKLLTDHITSDFIVATNLPRSAELTVIKSTTDNSMLICIVDEQKELPNIPLIGTKLDIRIPKINITRCTDISGGDSLIEFDGNRLKARFDIKDNFKVFELYYEEK